MMRVAAMRLLRLGPVLAALVPVVSLSAQRTLVPTIVGLSPASAIVGTGALRVGVKGGGFARGSVVRWKGVDRPTTFVSAYDLAVDLTAADVASLGSSAVTVFNATAGGSTSNAVAFTVGNPPPSLTAISPYMGMAGGEPFTLTVTGTSLVSSSVVRWNGQPRPTTWVSATKLTASIPLTDLATLGDAQITIHTPAPLGGSSGAMPLRVRVEMPTVSALTPRMGTFGNHRGFVLTVDGQSFIRSTVVRWNGSDRATTWVSASRLTAVILDSDMDSLGTGHVTAATAWSGQAPRESSARDFPIVYPAPTISSISPASVRLGAPATLLSINGTGFTPRSVVTINGRQAPELRPLGYDVLWQGNIAQSYLDSARVVQVRIDNPTPGGGFATADLSVLNPVPMLTAVSPQTRARGGAAFTLTVTGSWFVRGAVVRWNGSDRPTTFVNATTLTAAIPATDLGRIGDSSITVMNPAPGAVASATTLRVTVLDMMITIPD